MRTAVGIGGSGRAPARVRIAGRAICAKVTKLATGLPGSPMSGVPPITPMATGRPGLIATRQNTSVPLFSTAAFTQSASPVDTPPEVRIRSCVDAASLSLAAIRSLSSARMPRSVTSQQSLASIAISMLRLESKSCAGPRMPPGATISSPVENTATRTLRLSSTFAYPKAAASATSWGRMRWPAGRTVSPSAISSPAGRTLAPLFRPGGRRTPPVSSTRTSSCMNTVSAPSGIGAPVKTRTA